MLGLAAQVKEGIRILGQGGLVAFPTDTVFALGADAFNCPAVKRVYEVKSRPRQMAVPLLVCDILQIRAIAQSIPEVARFMIERFLPGGLTLILPAGESLPAYLGHDGGIAVRIPDHPVPRALAEGLGGPIVGTSANISGCPSALSAGEVECQIGGKVDFVIEDGRRSPGRESTIVSVMGKTPVVLREGVVPRREIEKACAQFYRARVSGFFAEEEETTRLRRNA